MNGFAFRKRFVLRLLVVVLPVLIQSCGGKKEAPKDDTPKNYRVLPVKSGFITLYNDYPATIQGQNVVEIRPKVDGFVEQLYVDEGSVVRKGQRLFSINNPQFQQELLTAQAGVSSIEAQVADARLQVIKTKPLVDEGIISKYQLQSAQLALRAQEAALSQARAAVAVARTNVGYTTITSPVDGVVGLLPLRQGSLVSSTSATPLTTISSTGNVYAYFAQNEKELLEFNRTHSGSTIQQKLASLPPVSLVLADGTLYPQKGRVQTASGLITNGTGSVNFRAVFPNAQGILSSGGSATVRIPQHLENVIIIPQSATYELQDKRLVYVVDAKNKLHSVPVTVTPAANGELFVVNTGLQESDRVVVEGLIGLKDSMTIRPIPINTDSFLRTIQQP
ncbi:MAG: efflux RND transporter periplasmic adaptor subunit [Sphingobacteriales bacterium]|nr:MAG: efflux RND transporter periplasmic adaptor subunit [Sphingobacteriales bacterium]